MIEEPKQSTDISDTTLFWRSFRKAAKESPRLYFHPLAHIWRVAMKNRESGHVAMPRLRMGDIAWILVICLTAGAGVFAAIISDSGRIQFAIPIATALLMSQALFAFARSLAERSRAEDLQREMTRMLEASGGKPATTKA
jgi:cobalamin biosynthesis protein CobD/CbiB